MGMAKMKFALNHKWKFRHWRSAFLSGYMQVLMVLIVTIISYFIIIFNDDIIEIVKDFLAIEVISALDDYFFSEHIDKSEVSRKVIDDD